MIRLPPLNALKAFEAAARHLSFKDAADELCVSQGAISRHILNLEQHLGTRLFERRHRQVVLTREGASYLHTVRDALLSISNATDAMMSNQTQRMLRLKMPPTCAIRWLVPRLAHFHALHPEISVQVTTSHDPVDFDRDDIDAGVLYDAEIASGLTGERLFNEVLLPVLSPALAGKAPVLTHPEDVTGQLLLHTIQRPDDWPMWFEMAGIEGIGRDQGLIFENSSLTIQGVIDGLGVAIAQTAFVIDELRTGRLIAPFDLAIRNQRAYFFVFPKERARIDKIRKFRAWIAQEAGLTRERATKYDL